ncbi:ribosome-inactivating family protein [Streptomyces sp. NPDC001027]|uniref:ribosome-inactivating family protein n=1 Tax=Streptomyces sp. NPDC001027 TaxID=3154771 RepID=UPI00331B1FD3
MHMQPVMDSAASPNGSGRQHRRRSRWLNGKFLAFFLAGAMLLGGAALVVPQFQEKASAIDDGKDITWDMSGGASAYNKMIDQVRQRATGGRVLRDGVLQTDPSTTDTFSINVRNPDVPSSQTDGQGFRLIMRARDLFVIGWVTQNVNGDAQVIFLKGDDDGYRGADSNNPLPFEEAPFGGNYTELEAAAGRGRTGIEANSSSWATAFRNMRSSTDQRSVAQALLMFIPAIAEGARFDPIQTGFAPSFNSNNGGSHTINSAEADLMNSWSDASKQMVDSLNNGTPINFRVDDPATPEVDFEANSLTALAGILAIALLQTKL